MEVIVDELKKNGVNVDIETFSEHIQYILGNYRDSYNEAVDRLNSEELILDVFHEMNVNTLGRAMAYLTLVYRTSHISNEDTTRVVIDQEARSKPTRCVDPTHLPLLRGAPDAWGPRNAWIVLRAC